nr:general odorant-binding protein 56d-like [Drosophila takahashii]
MKVLLISFFLVSLSVLATSERPVVKASKECAKVNQIPTEDALHIMKSYKTKNKTHKLKCFIKCVFERSPVLDVIRKRLKGQKQNCDSIKDADKCEESFKKFECFLKISQKIKQDKKG